MRHATRLTNLASGLFTLAVVLGGAGPAASQDDFSAWPVLRPTFPSTSGGGVMIKGYDPVVAGAKCMTTFMAVEPGEPPSVFAGYVEFEAVPMQGGTLCHNGRWRAFEGGGSGTTPFRVFLKDGVWRGA